MLSFHSLDRLKFISSRCKIKLSRSKNKNYSVDSTCHNELPGELFEGESYSFRGSMSVPRGGVRG